MNRVLIMGCGLSLMRRSEVVAFLLRHALARGGGYVCVSNVHTTVTASIDPAYREVQNRSLLTVPDGMPLVWGMNWLTDTSAVQDRVRGPTLMRELVDAGRKCGIRHYLFGGRPEVVNALQAALVREYPGAEIVGVESPPFRALDPAEEEAIINRVIQAGAHFVWVGLGAPKQERWMAKVANKAPAVFVGVGAAFDLIPGLVPEAPARMQNAGLEWFFRFLQEPRRLWKRYLLANPVFLVFLAAQVLRHKLFRRSYLREFGSRD